jgi:hypothetical protein
MAKRNSKTQTEQPTRYISITWRLESCNPIQICDYALQNKEHWPEISNKSRSFSNMKKDFEVRISPESVI